MAMEITPPSTNTPNSPAGLSAHRGRRSPNFSLDLKDLPALSEPSPPSNTLLITNLQAPEIFTAPTLDSIQRAINENAAIHTFAPLRSFRRIIVSFYSVDDAVKIRQVLDGESVLGSRVRVYFGQETRIVQDEDQHLQAPKSQKLFFISPPPSPPVGWEMRDEGPPNKDVHAEDLASALARLEPRQAADAALHEDAQGLKIDTTVRKVTSRPRSGTGTIVYDPEDHGHSPDLPAIAVEDLTAESPADLSPMEGVEKKFIHTARPPVELMQS